MTSVTPEELTEFRQLISQSVEHIYPGEWDLQVNGSQSELLIHFPEVQIRNSKSEKHTIKDLYVKVQFSNAQLTSSHIWGIRTTLSEIEASSRYAHSHLPSDATQRFNSFCLGSTAFNLLICELHAESWVLDKELWITKFEAFLFQLSSYVAWESIEGTPFRYIGNIGKGGDVSDGVDDDDKVSALLLFLSAINTLEIQSVLEFQLNEKTCEVNFIVTDAVETLMATCSSRHCYRDNDGNFYTTFHLDYQGREFEPFLFKGEVTKQVITSSFQHEDSRRKYAHREIVKFIKNELESRFRSIWVESTFPVYARRKRNCQQQREAYNSRADVLKNYTVAQSSE